MLVLAMLTFQPGRPSASPRPVTENQPAAVTRVSHDAEGETPSGVYAIFCAVKQCL